MNVGDHVVCRAPNNPLNGMTGHITNLDVRVDSAVGHMVQFTGAVAVVPESQLEPAPPEYFAGLDLGQAADYSALVVAERTLKLLPDRPSETALHYAVRHLHRWHLGTSYVQIAADLKKMYGSAPLAGSTLAIDRTGVGRGVSDMIASSGITARCRPFSITAGSKPGPGTVPKKELVAAIQVPLQERRLRFAEALPLTPVLSAELEHFRVKVTADRNESFESWRERDHDDLVLALALALYVGRGSSFALAVSYEELRPLAIPRKGHLPALY